VIVVDSVHRCENCFLDLKDRIKDRKLALKQASGSGSCMSNKEVVSDLLTRLPDDVSLQQIAREVEFIAGVREGMTQLNRGEGIEIEKIETLIESWTTR